MAYLVLGLFIRAHSASTAAALSAIQVQQVGMNRWVVITLHFDQPSVAGINLAHVEL